MLKIIAKRRLCRQLKYNVLNFKVQLKKLEIEFTGKMNNLRVFNKQRLLCLMKYSVILLLRVYIIYSLNILHQMLEVTR